MQRHDPQDVASRELVSKISLLGFMCLIVMERLYPALISADRLAYRFKVADRRKTLDPVLADLWTYGYASHTGTDNWRITDVGRQVIAVFIASPDASTALLLSSAQPSLPMTDRIVDNSPEPVDKTGDFLGHADRSSSDLQIDQSVLDRSSIDPEEENRREKIAWLDRHAVTGDKRKLALAAACTAADLDACLAYWTREGQTALGEPFRSKKYGPLNYAISCAINGDIPPAIDLPLPLGEGRGEGDNPSSANSVTEKISEPASAAPAGAPPPPTFDESKFVGMKPTQIWQAAQGELQLQMTRAVYDTWVMRTAVADWQADHLTVAVPDQYIKDWWDQRLMTTVTRILTGIVGRPVTVEFVVHTFPQK